MISDNNYYDCVKNFKILHYPGVMDNLYMITKDGIISSLLSDEYISWSIRDRKPYVNLLHKDAMGRVSLEPYYIKDLVAYNFIANARDYIERGYHSANVDGDSMNCNYLNIRYIDDSVLS